MNIVSLLEYDYKVSELCSMSDAVLFTLLENVKLIATEDQKHEYYVSQLILAGINYDESFFDKIFSHCILTFGFKHTYARVIIPLLRRIGLMWSTSKLPPTQEHFLSNLVRQKIFVAIDSLPPSKSTGPPTLLFLPENEFHDIPLLFAHFLLRGNDQRCIYLGANVPLVSLKESLKSIKPANLLFFLIHQDIPENVEAYIGEICKVHKGKIFLGGNLDLLNKLTLKNNNKIKLLLSINDLEENLV